MDSREINTQEIEGTEETREIRTCSCCGQIIEDDDYRVDFRGNIVCLECIERDYVRCDRCDEYVPESLVSRVNAHLRRGSFFVCDCCLENSGDYFQCDDCGDWVTEEYIHTDEFGHHICDDCYDREYYTCEGCGEIIDLGNVYWYGSHTYCEGCYPDERDNELIEEYAYKPTPIFYGNDGNEMYMGVELEIDKGDDRDSCAEDLHNLSDDGDLFYLKSDASLNYGIEIVTHPCTLEYHTESFPWKKICAIAEANGFKSHDANTCGLHVHVSRDALGVFPYGQEATIAKIVLLVDRFWDGMVRFSRRDIDKIDHWAAKPNAAITKDDSILTAVNKVKKASSSRYRAVNLGNESTIEFRMFRGTLNVNTIYATLQFVYHMCHFALNNGLENCMYVSWDSFIGCPEFPELRTYLDQRGLSYIHGTNQVGNESNTEVDE